MGVFDSSSDAAFRHVQDGTAEELERVRRELAAEKSLREQLSLELRASQTERLALEVEIKQAIFDRHAAERELRALEADYAVDRVKEDSARKQAEIDFLRAEVHSKTEQIASAHAQLESVTEQLQSKTDQIASNHAQLESMTEQLNSNARELESTREQVRELQSLTDAAAKRADDADLKNSELTRRNRDLQSALEAEQRVKRAILESKSWRLTEPARRFMLRLKTNLHSK